MHKSKPIQASAKPDYRNKFLQGAVANPPSGARDRGEQGNIVSHRKILNDQLQKEIEQRLQELRAKHQYSTETGKFAFKRSSISVPQADHEKKAEMLEAEERAPHSAQVTPNRRDRQRDEVQEAVDRQMKEQLEAGAALSR